MVFTDSIPLFAILLKPFAALLPNPFQYHGLWLLCCYILQGFFASRLLEQATKSPILNLLGTLFFLLNPVLVYRAEGHEALCGHWIILASLYLYFQADTLKNKIKWVAALSAATMIHFYLLVMVIIIWMGYLLRNLLEGNGKTIGSVIKFSTVSLAAILLVMWVIGYFVMDVADTVSEGFGIFSMNLLAPINPAPYNFAFLSTKSLVTYHQWEGFNYLGFGLLLLIVVAGYEFVRRKGVYIARRDLPLILIALVLFMLALSNKITFGRFVLFEADLPDFFDKVCNVIRANGRMFWPVSYLLMLAAIAIIVRYNNAKKAMLLLFVFVAIQIADFRPWYRNVGAEISGWVWQSPLKSDLWRQIVEKVEHIVFVPAATEGGDYLPFLYLAANHKKTMNVAYLARSPRRKDYDENLLEEFKKGKLQNDALYIIREGYFYKPDSPADFTCGILDGYPFIAPKMDLPELAPWPISLTADHREYTLKQLLTSFAIDGYAIILSMGNEATFKIPLEFANALKEKGSHIEDTQHRGSWAAIILNGRLAAEKIDNDSGLEMEYALPNYKIKVATTGRVDNDRSFLEINGFSLPLAEQGFNVVVLDLDNDKEVRRYSYNPDACDIPLLTSN